MEVTIKGDAKEIAALVVAIQERRVMQNEVAGVNRTSACLVGQEIPLDSELGKKVKACLDDCDCLLEA